MEIRRCAGRRHVADANHEVAEALAGSAFDGVVADDRAEQRHDFGREHGGLVENVQTRAVERGTEINVVFARRTTDEADFSEPRAAAAVGAAGDAERDGVVAQAGGLHLGLKLRDELRQVTLALGEGQAAGRQRHTRQGVKGEARGGVGTVELGLAQQFLDARAIGGRDARDDEVLVGREAEVAAVSAGDFAERGLERVIGRIFDAAAWDEEREVARAVLAFDPAVAVARVRELERPGRLELVIEPLLDLGAEPVHSPVRNRVFEARVLAVGAVAVVALHEHYFFGDLHHLIRAAEAERIGEARIGLLLVVRHALAAADGDVEAGELAGRVRNGDETEVVRVNVHIVARRNSDDGFEFPRQVSGAVERLVVRLAAGDEVVVDPDLVVGASARREVVTDGLREAERLGVQRRELWIRVAHHVAVDVAARG